MPLVQLPPEHLESLRAHLAKANAGAFACAFEGSESTMAPCRLPLACSDGSFAYLVVCGRLARSSDRKSRNGGAEKQEVTQEVKAVVEKVRDAFDEAANAQGMNRMKGASRFEPVDVMTQVVAGVNYFVKVKVGEGDEYAFLRIYDRFGDVQLTSFQLGKTASDPIAYFE